MTPRLGASAPDALFENWFQGLLVRGAVFRVHAHEIAHPKVKFIVFWGVDQDRGMIGYSVINSRCYSLGTSLPLPTGRYPAFLTHDSWLECYAVYEGALKKLKDALKSDPKAHVGQLDPADMGDAEQAIAASPRVERKLKRRYGF